MQYRLASKLPSHLKTVSKALVRFGLLTAALATYCLAEQSPADATFSIVGTFTKITQTIHPQMGGANSDTLYCPTTTLPDKKIDKGCLIIICELATQCEEIVAPTDTQQNTWHFACGQFAENVTPGDPDEPQPECAIYYTVVTNPLTTSDTINLNYQFYPLDGVSGVIFTGESTTNPLRQSTGETYYNVTPPQGGLTSCQAEVIEEDMNFDGLYFSALEPFNAGTISAGTIPKGESSAGTTYHTVSLEPNSGFVVYHEFDLAGTYGGIVNTTSQASGFAACTAEFGGA